MFKALFGLGMAQAIVNDMDRQEAKRVAKKVSAELKRQQEKDRRKQQAKKQTGWW